MTKRTLGKAMLSAGIITTGIVVAGISFTGDAGLQNIENNLNNMKTEFTQVVEDNTFLQTQYDKLEGFYESSVTKANDTIAGLTAQRDTYFNELNALRNDLDNQPTAEDDRIEIQAEINRLEGELTKANTKIAELEATAQAIDDETQVERVEKADYTAQEIEVESLPIPIKPEAMALNAELATQLSKFPNELTFGTSGAGLKNHVYKSVTVIDGIFTFEVESVFAPSSGIANVGSPLLTKFMKDNSLNSIYVTDGSGQICRFIFSNNTAGYIKGK